MTAPPLAAATRLPDSTWVRGRGLGKPVPDGPPPDFGLYLGASTLRRRHDTALTWPHEWVHWPDMWLPGDWHAAGRALIRVHERALSGEAVEIACHGGSGRTGTAIACLATLAGLTPREAVRWTRRHYRRSAVETPWQRLWISWFARNHAG
jgi:hypothetical protein